MSEEVELKYLRVDLDTTDLIGVITLNRPGSANALNLNMIHLLSSHIQKVGENPDCRALVLRGAGKNFSGGADLKWMEASQELDYDGNLEEATTLAEMFSQIDALDIPSIALVQGAAYGGAVGLAASCDFAVAIDGARFCLSEVRLGIVPAVIFPYLRSKMRLGFLKRFGLTGRPFSAEEALESGLIQKVVSKEDVDSFLREEINGLLTASPKSTARFNRLLRVVDYKNSDVIALTSKAIAEARVGDEAKSGFSSFFKGNRPTWVRVLPSDWSLDGT